MAAEAQNPHQAQKLHRLADEEAARGQEFLQRSRAAQLDPPALAGPARPESSLRTISLKTLEQVVANFENDVRNYLKFRDRDLNEQEDQDEEYWEEEDEDDFGDGEEDQQEEDPKHDTEHDAEHDLEHNAEHDTEPGARTTPCSPRPSSRNPGCPFASTGRPSGK